MLARPEIGTKVHIRFWLAGKPPDEAYYWEHPGHCACGQYWAEHVDNAFPHSWVRDPRMQWLNKLAQGCRTFGELYQKARVSIDG
jgi:hypothetical protein